MRKMLFDLIRAIARGLARWVELLGETACQPRETGVMAWRYLHEPAGKADADELPELPAGEMVPRRDPAGETAPRPAPRRSALVAAPSTLPLSVRRAIRRHRRAHHAPEQPGAAP